MAPRDWAAWAVELGHRISTDPRTAQTADLVVRQGGRLVHEEHWLPGELRDCFSVTKSVLAMLTGVAVRQGLVTLDERVDGAATVHDVLTMRRGVPSDPEDIDEVMALPAAWGEALRAVDRAWPAGSRFQYDNGAAHLLAIHLTEAFGEDLLAVARRELFDPLGIGAARWAADPEGYRIGTGHLELAAGDQALLGELLLRGGAGLLDPAWVRDTTTAWTPGGPPEGSGYGYLTWVAPDGFFFGGWAGQHVSVFPTHDLVVVTTGLPARLPESWRPARVHVTAAVRQLPDRPGQR